MAETPHRNRSRRPHGHHHEPDKVFFPVAGYTKLDLVNYYLAVADGALRGVMRRPMVLKRFVNGADKEPFFQKRAPDNAAAGIETAHITFPSGRTADLAVCDDAADLAWVVNLGCLDLNPWPVRATTSTTRTSCASTSTRRPRRTFDDVKRGRAGVQRSAERARLPRLPEDVRVARHPHQRPHRAAVGVHRRAPLPPSPSAARSSAALPALATTPWWKEERHGVFIDYNQNARDRTVASAYSVRPTPDARVSCPLEWDEAARRRARRLHHRTVPARYAAHWRPRRGNR